MREMRRQQEELQTRLREETQRKEELEAQIITDQRRIRDLQIRVKVVSHTFVRVILKESGKLV